MPTKLKPLSKKDDLEAKPEDWRKAPRPNYYINTNLQFPYSEYPRTFGSDGEYYSVQLPATALQKPILDFWGEGRIVDGSIITGFKDAFNINHQFQLVSNGPDKDKKIPNRIPTVSYTDVDVEKYLPYDSAEIITLMGAPIIEASAQEIANLISSSSTAVIVIYGIEEGHSHITTLEKALDSVNFTLSPLYNLSKQLNEPTLNPKLAFCPAVTVVRDATVFFQNGNMQSCATIVRALYRSSANQQCAHKALVDFFAQDSVKNSSQIFSLGYELKSSSEGSSIIGKYLNSNVVRILNRNYTAIRIVSNFSTTKAWLCCNGKVQDNNWQWGFFGATDYVNNNYNGGQNFQLLPSGGGGRFVLQSSYNVTNWLCSNGKVTSGNWQWAFFGANNYVNSNYSGAQYLYLEPIDGGNKFRIRSEYGSTAYLCSNGKVGSGNWQWAFFGSSGYLNGSSYAGGDIISVEFS